MYNLTYFKKPIYNSTLTTINHGRMKSIERCNRTLVCKSLKPDYEGDFIELDRKRILIEACLINSGNSDLVTLLHGLISMYPSSEIDSFLDKFDDTNPDQCIQVFMNLEGDYKTYAKSFLEDRFQKTSSGESASENPISRRAFIIGGAIASVVGIVAIDLEQKVPTLQKIKEISDKLKQISEEFKGKDLLEIARNHTKYVGLLNEATNLIHKLIKALDQLKNDLNTCINPKALRAPIAQALGIIERFENGDLKHVKTAAEEYIKVNKKVAEGVSATTNFVDDIFGSGSTSFAIDLADNIITDIPGLNKYRKYAKKIGEIVDSLGKFLEAVNRLQPALTSLVEALREAGCEEEVNGLTNDPILNMFITVFKDGNNIEVDSESEIDQMKRLARQHERGSQGPGVEELQRLLIEYGYLEETYYSQKYKMYRSSADGIYGKSTARAVKKMFSEN